MTVRSDIERNKDDLGIAEEFDVALQDGLEPKASDNLRSEGKQ